jgi:hypothetical protein
MNATASSKGVQGDVKIKITNSGDIGALILASESVICHRMRPADSKAVEDLYNDEACVTDVIFEHLSEVDARSTWEIQSVLEPPSGTPPDAKFVEVTVLLWYARRDRVEVGERIENILDVDNSHACRMEERSDLTVQRPRRIVYLRQGDRGDAYFALQASGEEICDASDDGRPRQSEYRIDESVGLHSFRLNYEGLAATR